ncbi:MAG: hypothetical protein JNN15_05480 [Blastocatellia bacterium]|nr:hypothetical protein [Blastocatellia bacterium]
MRKPLLLVLVFLIVTSILSSSKLSKASSSQVVSTVTFEFDGMMGLFTGNGNRVSVGILNAHHHTPEITVYKVIAGEKREIARLRGEQLKRTVNVSVKSNASSKLFRPSVYRALNGQASDERDFDWTLDMERDLYKRKLRIKDNFYGKIHFNSGIFFSSKLSDEMVKFISLDGKSSLPFLRQIAKPANKIDLTNEQLLTIEGLAEPISLTAQDDVDYFVSITNLPPQEMANIDHFKFYYDVIDEQLPRYIPIQVKRSYFRGATSCYPVSFERSSLD